jgi:hypothetical protein
MVLLMDPSAELLTEGETARARIDLAGIAAIKESAAREYKEQGNQLVRMDRKHYVEGISSYSKSRVCFCFKYLIRE